jgi:Secretion system C-terminal sorting domain/Beta-propeller repeat
MTFKYLQKDYYKPVSTELNSSNMGYIENRGQVRNSNGTSNTALRFYNDKSSPSTYIDDAKIGYVWNKSADTSNTDTLFRVDMQFNKGNTGKKVYPLDFKSEYYNFYLKPLTVGKERTLACNSVVKFDAYINTDIIFTHNQKGYKTYLIARSGAPTANFEMQYTGQSSLTVNGTGQLVIGTSIGSKIQPKAKAYTMNSTTGVLTLLGWQPTYIITSGNKVSFTYGTWPAGSTLVIEMEKAEGNGIQGQQAVQNVDWSTYFGGSSYDQNFDIAATPTNQVYTCGETDSPNYPINPIVTYYDNSSNDAFIAKFDELCVFEWLVYYGGVSDEAAKGINIDVTGSINVVGFIQSSILGYSSTGLNDNTLSGTADGLYLRLNNLGELKVDSYIGGIGQDVAMSVTSTGINDNEDASIFIVGYSNNATSFPIQSFSGAYNQSAIAGVRDGFIAMDNTSIDNDDLEWGTFYGGEGDDWINDIDMKAGVNFPNIVITGITKTEIYASAEPFNPVCGVPLFGGFPDCAPLGSHHQSNYQGVGSAYGNNFVSEFSGNNFGLVWATYFGLSCINLGVQSNNKSSIASYGKAFPGVPVSTYITGCANSSFISTFPYQPSTNVGAYNKPYGTSNSDDGFIAKFAYNNSLEWSTFIGGDGADAGYGLAVDKAGDVFVTGTTDNIDLQPVADYCNIPSNEAFPICDLNGTYYIETNTPEINERNMLMAFNKNNQIKWSTQYGIYRSAQGNGLSTSDDKLFLTGFTANSFTLLEFDEFGSADYFQNGLENLSDGTIARFDISEITTGLYENANANSAVSFSVYPNPAHNKLEVISKKSFGKNELLLVLNLTGQVVIKTNLEQGANKASLDISKLASGVFTVQVVSSNTSSALKFIKE